MATVEEKMNQRLQELYLEATEHMKTVQDQGLPAPYQTRALAGKLAELIVQECIEICDDEDDGSFDTKSVRLAMIRIKKHFGVE
jgi:hypothetical protein